MLWDVEVRATHHDAQTGAVTEVTYKRSRVEAPDWQGAKNSGWGLALAQDLAELLTDPDTGLTWTMTPEGFQPA